MNFIKIPRGVIYDVDMGKRRAMIFSYFAMKRCLDDESMISCDNAVEWCGYSVDRHKGKINERITKEIYYLSDIGYFEIGEDFTANRYVAAKLNVEFFDVESNFAIIYTDEIKKIRNFKKYTDDTQRMSSSILLLVLSYFRVNMLRRPRDYAGDNSEMPEFFYRMYVDIADDIGISARYVSRAANILEEMGLIAIAKMPGYKDLFDCWHSGVTIFVNKRRFTNKGVLDDKYNYQQELEWGIEYVRKNKKRKGDQ